MKLNHIKDLLIITCNFNASTITHTFAIDDGEDALIVKCIKDTFIIEITSRESRHIEQYTSVDQAAERLFNKMDSNKVS
ncbi:hypothetical protein QOZ98_000321 [Planomicrobium stackebrandtii]|uniref:Uncharacterized protein n=1 Tax=Planomicrobium stackebrandtii TaxID=253160 RepID=A0ABU0GQ74_9BACL|nr:hypothetical protein [Planomicrobium stackebrandtii]MDQ0427496.1 hypothetical protein [Planomicrobium stackebrandtii]